MVFASHSRPTLAIAQMQDLDRPAALLPVDRAGDADRLMGRLEMQVAGDLARHLAAQTAQDSDVRALGRAVSRRQ